MLWAKRDPCGHLAEGSLASCIIHGGLQEHSVSEMMPQAGASYPQAGGRRGKSAAAGDYLWVAIESHIHTDYSVCWCLRCKSWHCGQFESIKVFTTPSCKGQNDNITSWEWLFWWQLSSHCPKDGMTSSQTCDLASVGSSVICSDIDPSQDLEYPLISAWWPSSWLSLNRFTVVCIGDLGFTSQESKWTQIWHFILFCASPSTNHAVWQKDQELTPQPSGSIPQACPVCYFLLPQVDTIFLTLVRATFQSLAH